MTFRRRIMLAMLPLFALLVVLGGTGIILIYHLGSRIDKILRENYDSVIYMRDLNEALERIDSSFQFALAGREKESYQQYVANWKLYDASLSKEQHNITLPGEADLVDRLTKLSDRYRRQGDDFFKHPGPASSKLLLWAARIDRGSTTRSGRSRPLPARSCGSTRRTWKTPTARPASMARSSLIWYSGGLAIGIALAVFLIASTIRTILYPIRAVTESATAIGAGDLDQLVPISSDDELGQLASAFNAMARQLRDYRQSHQAQLLRAQQTSQATINSFPDPVLVVDRQQRVELVNPVARRLFGVLPREAGGDATVRWQPPPPLQQPLADVLETQREYLPEGFDKVVMLPVGENMHSFLPRILPIRDAQGETVGAAILLEDVTRFRLLDEVKNNLVATVSHELKNPLTSIRLALHLLLEETLGPLSPKQLELLVDARDNAERLLGDDQQLARPGPAGTGAKPTSVAAGTPGVAVAGGGRIRLRAGPPTSGIELLVDAAEDLPPVAVDAEQLQHALQNLLDNALIHTPQGGRITVSARRQDGKMSWSRSPIPARAFPPSGCPSFSNATSACRARPAGAAAAWGWRSCGKSSPPTAARSPAKAGRESRPSSV